MLNYSTGRARKQPNKQKTKVFFGKQIEHLSQKIEQIDKENLCSSIIKEFRPTIKSSKNLFDELLRVPVISRNFVIQEMKCMMAYSEAHTSQLLTKKFVKEVRKKLARANLEKDDDFRQDGIEKLVEMVSYKLNDSLTIMQIYQECVSAYEYPVTVKLLLLYLGVFLYSMNGMYDLAESNCNDIFNCLLLSKVQEYLVIYLLLMIKLKTNLSQWADAEKYLIKLLTFSWMYQLIDLESWCYFQFSRVYFFKQQIENSNFFQKKSERSIFQPEDSIYRQVLVAELKQQLQRIKMQNINLSYTTKFLVSRLADIPKEKTYEVNAILQKKRMQGSLRQINQVCKIRHVKNLLPRITNTNSLAMTQKMDESDYLLSIPRAGNPFFITHESRVKNLNMYFRIKKQKLSGKNPHLYTMENSGKSWIVLKQMTRNILLEMRSINKSRSCVVP